MSCCSTMASLLNASSFICPQQKVGQESLSNRFHKPCTSQVVGNRIHRTKQWFLANHVRITTNIQSRFYHAGLRNGRPHLPRLTVKVQVAVEGDVVEKEPVSDSEESDYGVVSMHHVGILCENLERSLDFYQNILGLKINEARPHDKLPYRGAWLWVGSEMIHLMELPNPDPLTGRPQHGGRDRHTCIAIRDVSKLKTIFDKAGISYTLSHSGRPAIFTRDPDANALEFTQVDV